ncbi:MAG TPA: lytic transglycosylase domain-containing protein [Rhizomicrobium sp.]|nr:lytic transglycosylase domain-containing protein [Rhizomicrobium sp.]
MIRTRFVLAAAAFAFLAAPALAVTTTATGVAPAVLSPSDVTLYKQIFAAERLGDFETAKQLVAQLSDTSLVGYAQAEHYLSPHSGATSVQDLVAWLEQYKELSIADRVYALAVKRSIVRVKKKHHKVEMVAVVTNIPAPPTFKYRGGGYEDAATPDAPYQSDAARAVQGQIEAAIKSDQPDQALAVLQSLEQQGLPAYDLARVAQRVSASYLAEGMDSQALAVASRYANSDGSIVPVLNWSAGFASYRLRQYDQAATYFERLAQSRGVSNRLRAQGAFWAARAHIQSGDSLRVVTMLSAAAREEPTFYGLLAERILGQDPAKDFAEPVLTPNGLAALSAEPHAHRAIALWQIGEDEQIPEEMNRAFAGIDTRLDPEFAAVARYMHLPNLELRASETTARTGKLLTGLFPVPNYQPIGGYTIDPSLVLAFARAESHFRENAGSPAGARGLMQIMPGTATHLGGDPSRLTDPSYSLMLGNKYIAEMLDFTHNNLFQLAAAYNAGPGSLQRWLGSKDSSDPLLFIESLPVRETRDYIKQVLTYHWMYRRVLSRNAPTLDETAGGGWPVYHASDFKPMPRPAAPPQQQPDPTPTPAVPPLTTKISMR